MFILDDGKLTCLLDRIDKYMKQGVTFMDTEILI